MKLIKTYSAGVPIPAKISCGDEIVLVTREGRTATVETVKGGTIARLKRIGFQILQEETITNNTPSPASAMSEPPPKKRRGRPPKPKEAVVAAPLLPSGSDLHAVEPSPSPAPQVEPLEEPEGDIENEPEE